MWRTFPVRRTADERIFLAVFFLYIKKYATWCPLSQQMIVPTLTIGLTFNICRVTSVSSSSSRQSQTSAGGTACSRLPWPAVLPHRPHRPTLLHCWPGHSSTHPHLLLFSGDGSRTSQPSYSPPPATGPAHLQWLLFVPSEASPSSSALRPWFARRARCAALLRCQRRQQPRGARR